MEARVLKYSKESKISACRWACNRRQRNVKVCMLVKATVGLNVHMEMLTKRPGPDGNEKGDVPLGNLTLPEDLAEIVELPAQTSVSKRTLVLLYPLNK